MSSRAACWRQPTSPLTGWGCCPLYPAAGWALCGRRRRAVTELRSLPPTGLALARRCRGTWPSASAPSGRPSKRRASCCWCRAPAPPLIPARPACCLSTDLPPGPELAEWRRRVQQDPACFLQLCRYLRCVPNIWALHEWGNWLTPVPRAGRGDRRYDTAFYLCCLEERPPHTSQDEQEVTGFQWSTPPEAIELFKSQEIWFAPPQFYELCRLCNFTSLCDLHRFGSDRALEGCERWMPVTLAASDGYIQLLPGDELYPKDPDYTGEKKLFLSTDKKVEELMKEDSKLHRVVIQNLNNLTVHVNIQPKYKHINPLKMDSNIVGSNADCNSRL
uniref:Nudix hydrolase 19 n=1 Tax=Chrysemys picta bellii TaxID=8478 RepID=A0A8C3EY56_CHRPI